MFRDIFIGLQITLALVLVPLTAAAYNAPVPELRLLNPALSEAPAGMRTPPEALSARPAAAEASSSPRVVMKAMQEQPAEKPAARQPVAKRVARTAAATRRTTGDSWITAAAAPSSTSELTRARQLLAAQITRYPILRGTTVSFGDTSGYQAIAYYQSGRIIISRSHTASLERIIAHEVWHVIDWRDNGRIDWGENVPR